MIASSVLAADIAFKAPPPATWTGFYIGGGIGRRLS
jgi:hypothetical protein